MNRKYLTGVGYLDSQIVELFGEPFVYDDHDIWAAEHIHHIEKTVVFPAAKLLATLCDDENVQDLIERYRRDESGAAAIDAAQSPEN